MVFHHQNPQLVVDDAVINRIRKALQCTVAYIAFDDRPPLRLLLDIGDCYLKRPKKRLSQITNSIIIKTRRYVQLSFSVGMVDYPHPSARRTASMTCSCDRPATEPDVKSESRRRASCTAS